MRFCAPAVFTTGSTEMIRVETDKAPNWTGDGDEIDVLAQGNYDVAPGVGTWGHHHDGAQVTIAKAKPGANRIVIGLTAMQNLGVLLDFPPGQLGLHAAKTCETLAPSRRARSHLPQTPAGRMFLHAARQRLPILTTSS